MLIVESGSREATWGFEPHGDRQRARSQAAVPTDPWAPAEQRLALVRTSAAADERRRLARDLHDSVQNELLCLILELELAENDRNTPFAFADKLAAFRARAEASLDSIREILHGELPSMLAARGFDEAIRERANRAPTPVGLVGTAPRSNDAAEEPHTSRAWRRFRTWPSTHAAKCVWRSECDTATEAFASASRTTAAGSTRNWDAKVAA